jgi:hypothetical protein
VSEAMKKLDPALQLIIDKVYKMDNISAIQDKISLAREILK